MFFKQPTSWRPRISRDLMVSVALSGEPPKPNGVVSQLPVQVYQLEHEIMSTIPTLLTYTFSHTCTNFSCCPISSHLKGFKFQVLTLQASNLTSEDLTMTVLAPASNTSPSVISLNSSPSSPMSPYVVLNEVVGRVGSEKYSTSLERPRSIAVVSENQKHNVDFGGRTVSFREQSSPISDIIPSAGLGCSHLWLQSRVPLG